MRQCELEQVQADRDTKKMKRTGIRMTTLLDGVDADMQGSIIELRKVAALWVIDKVDEVDVQMHQIKRHWHVGDL